MSFFLKMKLLRLWWKLKQLFWKIYHHNKERSTAFHSSQQENVNQLNQNIFFKRQLNQEYNNQSYKQKNHNHYQTTEVENDSSKNVDLARANTVPDNKSYADAVMSHNTKNGITKKVIVFWDSIIRGMRVKDFHQQVKNGYTKFKSFPGCNSKEMLHYIKPTLETSFYKFNTTRWSKWSAE